MSRVLVVTNDFPPHWGGIETFVDALCRGIPPEDLVVHASQMPGDAAHDRTLPYVVHRDPTRVLLPTPAVADRASRLLREHECDTVLFGASAPLGLLAPRLRREGARRVVGLTHGHEVWWAAAPGTRQAMRRIGEGCDALTYVSEWCRRRIAPALRPEAAERMEMLAPGVDTDRFRPGCGREEIRRRHGIGPDRPVVVCASRMVPRKGQDVLLAAWPRVLERVPGALLLLVGDGPIRPRLQRRAVPLGDSVLFTGKVPTEEVPRYGDAGDVFAMPCRARRGGLEVEAFGIVFVEAAALGKPVLVGDSGGAPETVVDGETGYVVPPEDPAAVAERLVQLLRDPAGAAEMGRRGRERVVASYTWDRARERMGEILRG